MLQYKKTSKGSITIFLSLILLIILSLIMTVIEGARVSTAKVVAQRALTTAMDSVLAGYYGPLMEEYHILGLDTGYGSRIMNGEEMVIKMSDYMTYTLSPDRVLAGNNNNPDFLDISLKSLIIRNHTGLMDYQGELFINEAVEYMKYKELGNGMEKLLEKMSLLETPKKVSVVYEEKLKVEEELVAIDEGILSLMMYFDGITTGKNGLKTNKDGTLRTEPYFIKKICFGAATEGSVGINNGSIFLALKDRYVDPTQYFQAIQEDFNQINANETQINNLETEISGNTAFIEEENRTLDGLKNSLSGLKKKDPEYKTIKEQINSCNDRISNFNSRISACEADIYNLVQQNNSCTDDIYTKQNNIIQLITNIRSVITNAEGSIDRIIESSDKADPLIKGYEEVLNKEKDGLGEEIYSGLEEGLQELKRYQTGSKSGYDFPSMKNTLNADFSVLNLTESILAEGGQALSQADYQKARESFQKACAELAKYQTSGLRLDYSSLSIRKSSDDSLNMIKDLVESGLTAFVIDPDTISDLQLSEENLPSQIAASVDAENTAFDFKSLFSGFVIGGRNAGLSSLFGNFGDYSITEAVNEGVNIAAEHLLFQAYLQEHFYRFPMEGEDIKARKPSVLAYEQEYLLAGKASDKDNLASVISRIILLRTILNFTTTLGDSGKWGEAKAIAAALVGFTGLPVLVTVTQTLLVILLAFAEALVDTCALLKGKDVMLLKNKVTLNFADLLLLNRTFIQSKAEAYPKEETGLSLNYPDYLKIFLFMKSKKDIAYRSMDLIQENIRIRYEDNFTFTNCIFGFEAEAAFLVQPKFTSLSFVRKYINGSNNSEYTVQAGYSY